MRLRSIDYRLVIPAIALILAIALNMERAHAEPVARAYFAGGCFWCVESDFEHVKGVDEVISGFSGGTVRNPTYKQVTAGGTGHYEAVEIRYDPDVVSYERLLYLFFRSVDPTDAGGQFCDRGDSYRTAIFVQNRSQMEAAQSAKAAAEKDLGRKIVTPILQFDAFFPADSYHQDYYKQEALVLTRRGPKTKASAYKFYRNACGRDDRIRQLWGPNAPFLHS